ncbi:hypothetical protein DSCO28_34830 [Desulfosarcina ovata subsp. sediminis]|uniref:OmpA-like domain-containing protein n=1 Tax=Desulfosarcina ovata subsp. sediminis TaxID=885957 RepID=A0A5K7ZQ00_9BACT|nr:OmpA family protein [Desulfosarcina ovata]BBO82917.1 hypothetical protein DSCO28_34830 [Desulfosarcina ovata subsp. sediminis]
MRPISVRMFIAAIFLLTACGHRSTVILVPDPNGAVGEVTVTNAAGSVRIDRANHATTVRDDQTLPDTPEPAGDEKIEQLFGAVLRNQPPSPVHFILYFQSDSEALLPASRDRLPDIIATVKTRMPTRVSVVGHTDTMGDKAYNTHLSMRRAQAVRKRLVSGGIADDIIDVSSHGEENPLVKTADNVANAKNRRVEVVVR